MRNLKCPSCGAKLSFSEDREFGFCEYCGEKIVLDDYRSTQRIIDEAKIKEVEVNREIRLKELELEESRFNKQQKRKNLNMIFIIVGILIIITIVGLILLKWKKKDSNNAVSSPIPTIDVNSTSNTSVDVAIPYDVNIPSLTNNATGGQEASSESAFVVKDYEYCVTNGYAQYYVKLYNPSSTDIIICPAIRVSARDANGVLLGTSEQVFNCLYPNQESNQAGLVFSVEEAPSSFSIEALPIAEYNIQSVSLAKHKEYIPLETTGVTYRKDTIVGEIVNKNDYTISQVKISAVIRDNSGKMIAADITFADSVPANGSIPFSLYSWGLPSDVIIETYAENWGYDY